MSVEVPEWTKFYNKTLISPDNYTPSPSVIPAELYLLLESGDASVRCIIISSRLLNFTKMVFPAFLVLKVIM